MIFLREANVVEYGETTPYHLKVQEPELYTEHITVKETTEATELSRISTTTLKPTEAKKTITLKGMKKKPSNDHYCYDHFTSTYVTIKIIILEVIISLIL